MHLLRRWAFGASGLLLDVVNLLLLNSITSQSQYQVDQRINRVVMLLASEAQQLGQQMLAAGAWKLDRPVLDVSRRNSQPRTLILDRVHRRDGERAPLQLFNHCLLIRNSLDEELAA